MVVISPLTVTFPPEGSASIAPQTLQWTVVVAWLKTSCSFPQSGHFTRRNLLLGFGMTFSHSLILFPPLLDGQFLKAYSLLMSCVSAGFASELQRLFLCCFGKRSLARIFLSAVPFLFVQLVMSFTLCQSPSLPRLVYGNCVRLMSSTFWTIRSNFFGCFYCNH